MVGNWGIPGTATPRHVKTRVSGWTLFKPGYASLETGASNFVGQLPVKEGSWPWSKELKYRIHGHGIVELPKVRTKKERWHASFVGVSGYTEKELPLLYKAREEEDRALSTKGKGERNE